MKSSAAFRLPGFRRLAAAYLVNELGNWLGEIALAVLVFELTGSAMATAALFVALQFVPALTAPPLIAKLDTLHSRRTLAVVYLAEAGTFCVLAALAAGEGLVLAGILLLAALDGTLAATARARTRAAAAAILEPAGLLREGNGILNVGFTAGAAGGPALAGLLISLAGVQFALLADAVSFLAVAVLIATAAGLPSARGDTEGSWAERLRRGFAYVRERPTLARLLVAEGIAFIFFALVLPIEVAFAKDTLDAGDIGYGLMLASWGTGMVLGSVLFSALGRVPLVTLLVIGTVGIGAGYTGTAVSPTLLAACICSAVGGVGNGIQWVAMITAVQALTAPAYQARVIGLLEALSSGMSGIGFVLGGAIAALASPRAGFAVAGIGVLAVLAAAVVALRDTRWERDAGTTSGAADVAYP